MNVIGISLWKRASIGATLFAALWAAPAQSAVTVRVEARPVSDPIQVFVSVTNSSGQPVTGLRASDFTVLVDGNTVSNPTFSQPTSQDPNRRTSVVLAMDMSNTIQQSVLDDMQQAVVTFINSMQIGDYAAIVKFNNTNPNKASVVQDFTRIDKAAGNSALVSAVMAPYPGSGTNVLDAALLSVQTLRSPSVTLPNGPKAVVLISDGRDNASTTTLNNVVTTANQASIPIFTIGIGQLTASGEKLLSDLASGTSATFLKAPTSSQITNAYAQISQQLSNEYLLTFNSSITDCGSHQLEVRVTSQSPASTTFTRCTATTPPPRDEDGGGGGGGRIGATEVVAGLALLVLARRRWTRRGADTRG